MHDAIFQLSSSFIEKEEYAKPEDFYINTFADYIGKEIDERRYDEIKWLARSLSDIFEIDKKYDALVYKGGIVEFKNKWISEIRRMAEDLTIDTVVGLDLFRLKKVCERTHIDSASMFQIKEWSGEYPVPLSELIEYVDTSMQVGDMLFVGAIIDYHY